MPKDIRSYFAKSPKDAGPKKKPKTKSIAVLSSDEDDPKAESQAKQKVSKKPSRRHALSDSEDESPVPKKKQETIGKEPAKEEKLKPAQPGDIFGKRSISRVAAPQITKKVQRKEAEFYDNDDFDTALTQLDMGDLEVECLDVGSTDGKINSKRKHSGDSDEDTKVKKIRQEGTKEEEVIDKDKKERKISSEDENSAKKHETEKRESSASGKPEVKDESSAAMTSEPLSKLQFNKINRNKKGEDSDGAKEEGGGGEAEEEEEEEEEEGGGTGGDGRGSVHGENGRKKGQAVLDNKYLQHSEARNPGSKSIPEGAKNCLADLTFLITGVLDSLERDEAEELIKKYGGQTVTAISKNTDYLIVGNDTEPSKLAKVTDFGTKQISEDQLLDLIRSRPPGKARDVVQPRNDLTSRNRSRSPDKFRSLSPKKTSPPAAKPAPKVPSPEVPPTSVKEPEARNANPPSISGNIPKSASTAKVGSFAPAQALVDKYRPKNMKTIIGQHGDKSNAWKLHAWLTNWYKNRSGDVKLAKPSPWAKNDDGAFFKAALLSGPPGVGKTTTAQVVSAELGFDLLEFNASDTRSKRLLKEEVSGILSNTTVKGYFTSDTKDKLSKKHVLLMDEVDGMAGNEDRGGLQELIALIKSSEVPIICICNDRNHPKMRTLSNYTFDLRFQKPRLEQIKGAMKSLCCKEQIKISNDDLEHLIQSTNQDIRQVINHLAMLSSGNASQETAKGKQMNKDLRLGPWDVIAKVFNAEDHAKMSIHDKSDLFFHDYGIAGLFVQENYLSVQPKAPKNEWLARVAKTADSLAVGDVIENAIRGSGAWSLLPTQACFSSVIPGSLMSGRLAARANFPAWLGRNSRRGKFDRLLQEITVHTRLATGASKEAINIDYLNHLRDSIVRPLTLRKNEGVDEALNVMNHYHLLREDLESLMEVSLWPGQPDPMQAIESKVKAALTRAYNKSAAPAPYITNAAVPKKKAAQASQDEGFMDGEDEEDGPASDVDNDDMESDRMIKAKKATASDKNTTSSKAAAKPKAKRGRGRGKAK